MSAARMPLLSPASVAALLLGMLAATRLPVLPHPAVIVVLLLAGGGLWLLCPDVRRGLGALVLGFALLMAQGSLRLAAQLPSALAGQDIWVHGRIVSLPVHEERRSRFHFQVADSADLPVELRGQRLRLSWYDGFAKADDAAPSAARHQLRGGETWQLQVRLKRPRGLRNPGGIDSERQMLLENMAAQGTVRDAEGNRRLASGSGIIAWREAMAARIHAGTPAGGARFVAALAIGDTRGLSDTDWQTLRATGLTHLIAISGFHVGMVGLAAAGLMFVFCWLLPGMGRFLPRRIWMLLAASLAAFAYLLATGAALPTVRTVLMMAFAAGAMLLRRQTHIGQTVALALAAMLFLEPLSILQPGFWLSFAGVAWLAWVLQSARRGVLRQFLLAQAVATLGLLPLTAVFFAQASLAGPLANLLAVPWWSLVVVPLSIFGVLAEMLVDGSGRFFWGLAAQAFEPSWQLFTHMAESPFALARLPEAAGFALPLALLGIFVLMLPRGMPGKSLAAILLLPLLWPWVPRPAAGGLEIVQLDVGQGSAILLRTQKHDFLYDTGPATPGGFDAGESVVLPALHALGVRHLQAIIISHADADHAGGLAALQRAFPGAQLWAPPGAGLVDARDCTADIHWQHDGVGFAFLHPVADFPYLKNQSSCVLRLQSQHGNVLLTGDIDRLIEARLLRMAPDLLQAEILTVPHHGSAGSSSPAFVQATGAQLALVSAGHGNRFGHPRQAVLARWQQQGAQTPISYEYGALHVRLTADGIDWQGERSRKPRFWDAVLLARADTLQDSL
ncbi:DNA internalization-related competence protein ComEC/Rec2 [Lysobacteraceae bacterium NML120232]|nr:DNA internalization-related competence protein ComEC/Rec2 [Xanthomonadaceae bacterium NML120232]